MATEVNFVKIPFTAVRHDIDTNNRPKHFNTAFHTADDLRGNRSRSWRGLSQKRRSCTRASRLMCSMMKSMVSASWSRNVFRIRSGCGSCLFHWVVDRAQLYKEGSRGQRLEFRVTM
ncbi:hypothetical protein LA080_003657 [Diaporthe eres]|nr:hypothetical protein LA080_003657 [Diaporthe eres]